MKMKTTALKRATPLTRTRPQVHQNRPVRRREDLVPIVASDLLRDMLQDAENMLLDPRASMHMRGEVAARIAVHLAG